MPSLALSPVSAAVYGALNVSSLTALATGGVYDDVPQGVGFPFVLYRVEEQERRGFGAGSLLEVALRVHVFSTYAGLKEAQTIGSQVVELLKDVTLTVSGYRLCGRVFYDETLLVGDELINGVKCHELALGFRIYVEPSA